jgi:hypothetical protein
LYDLHDQNLVVVEEINQVEDEALSLYQFHQVVRAALMSYEVEDP